MKIGILGGTFDPIHLAHVTLAKAARDAYLLDEVWFVPAKIPPHKQDKQIASEEHRSQMILAAIQNEPGFRLCTIELERDAVSYTAETLRLLRSERPLDQFFYLMGEDSLRQFPHWYHPEQIVWEASVLVAPRPDGDKEELARLLAEQNERFGNHFFSLPTKWLPISSTDVRERIKSGLPFAHMLPEGVVEYILSHGVYTDAPDLFYLQQELRLQLSKKRYYHSMGVAYTAAALAMRYQVPVNDALLAGWLHDCAKEMSEEALRKECQKQGIAISKAEEKNWQLLHGKAGASLAKHIYGVKQQEILDAIRYHVTGRPDMTILEQIVYIADYIEPSRTMLSEAALSQIRAQAFWDLPGTVCRIADLVLQHLREQDAVIDEHTQETYEFYKKKTEEQT